MDFSTLTTYFVAVVVVGCLVVGYIIKHASFLKWIKNDDIPVILAAFGVILNVIVSRPSVESIVYGAVMGLASTGMHQAFRRFIEGTDGNTEKEEEDQDDQ